MERTYKLTDQQALEMYSADSYLTVNKKLVKALGIEVAVFLSNLIDKYKYFRTNNIIKEGDWFVVKYKYQTREIGMSPYKIKAAKKVLKELNILETKVSGAPPKESYKLHISQLLNFLIFKDKETCSLKIKKPHLSFISNNKVTKTKQKSIKNKSYKSFPREWRQNEEFKSSLNDFVKMRNKSIYPLTETAITKIVNKLTKYTIAEAIQALDDSVEGNYRGLFPKKTEDKRPNKVGFKSQVKHTKGRKI